MTLGARYRAPMWSLLAGCSSEPPTLVPYDHPEWFADGGDSACALVPTGAWWASRKGWLEGVAADDRYVYTSHADDVTWILVVDAATQETVGQVALPLGAQVRRLHRAGDWLFGVNGPKVQILDVSDPTSPAVLGVVNLGDGLDANAFAAWGDRVYTDGGTALYIDLGDPAAPGVVSATPSGRIQSPVVVGDDLLGARPIGDTCLAQVYDAAGPTLRATLDLDGACPLAGLAALDDGSVIAVGVADLHVDPWVAHRLVRDAATGSWQSEAAIEFPSDFIAERVEARDRAVVLGYGGTFGTAGAIRLGGDPLTIEHTWWPDVYRDYTYIDDLAATPGAIWANAWSEGSRFGGLIALEPEPCP